MANGVLRLLGVGLMDEVSSTYTREEVAALVEESRGEGLLEDAEYDRLSGALGFTERTVETVLLHARRAPDRPTRVDRRGRGGAVRRDRLQPVPGGRRRRLADRLPAHQGRARDRRGPAPAGVEDKWIRPFAQVRTDDLLHDALEKLQRRGAHMARVVDDDGATLGVATLEDVIEELVGEIRDTAHLEPSGGPTVRPGTRPRRDRREPVGRLGCLRRSGPGVGPRAATDELGGEGADGGGRREDAGRPRVDRPQHAQHAAAARRAPLPLAGARPGGGRLGAGRADGLGRHRLARRLAGSPAQPDVEARQILDPVADRLYILAVVVGLALRDIIPWWLAVILPLRDVLLCWLVPLLRTRGYSALPVHFLGKAATFNLLYAFPLLLLGDGTGAAGHPGQGLRLGVRDLGDRAVLVGRLPLRLPGLGS